MVPYTNESPMNSGTAEIEGSKSHWLASFPLFT
jgi:hypothetical protein